MTGSRVLAVDLGATSVRVAAVDLAAPAPEIEILHRWHHRPTQDEFGSLRWDWAEVVEQVETGLDIGLAGGPVASIGVDGWGVDYGLIDGAGDLVDAPYAYRDSRTDQWEATVAAVGAERLYRTTGVQFMAFNTIFQLVAESRDRLAASAKLLLLPDLLVNHLTGYVGAEVSNMSTTGLMDVRTREWDTGLVDEIALPRDLLAPPTVAGTRAGSWRDVPVNLVGSHDTASAFIGIPATDDIPTVFVSTGSWVIVGVEQAEPNTSDDARLLNFSNEAGALGGVRFLKNVVGFWILEQCREALGSPSIEILVEEASAIEGVVPTFDASDHRFVNPPNMITEVLDAARLPQDTVRAVVARSVIESIVHGVAKVIEEIIDVTGQKPQRAVVVGGASRIPLVGELLASQTELEVVVGSSEATALGNAIVQGIAIGQFEDLNEARRWVGAAGDLR